MSFSFRATDILSINPFFSLLKENHFMSLRIEPRVAPLTNAFEVSLRPLVFSVTPA